MTNAVEINDIESMRLNELSSQLSMAQSARIEAQSRKHSAQSNAADSPDVALSPVIQSLRIQVAAAESKLAELGQTLSKNHPQYQAAEAQLNKTKIQLREETQRASNSIGGAAGINQQREAELRAAVAKQKQRLLELNLMRGEMSVLQKDVETAQKAIDAVTLRFSQTNIEGHSDQSDIAMLNPAIPPLVPSSPKMILAIVLAVLMGGVLGVGFALLAEFMDRRIRCREDITELLEIPVFALIDSKPKKLGKVQKLLALT